MRVRVRAHFEILSASFSPARSRVACIFFFFSRREPRRDSDVMAYDALYDVCVDFASRACSSDKNIYPGLPETRRRVSVRRTDADRLPFSLSSLFRPLVPPLFFFFSSPFAFRSMRLQMRIGKSVSRVVGECSGRADKRHGFALITILHRAIGPAALSLSLSLSLFLSHVPSIRGIRSLRSDTSNPRTRMILICHSTASAGARR
jgi:hypothetical protein